MRPFVIAGRVFVMGVVVFWYLALYGFGRLRVRLLPRGERARARARLQGRILRRVLTTLGATFIKLGQVLSTRPDLLEPEVIDELKQLQDKLPPFSFERARRQIEGDLGGPVEQHFAEIEPAPVAAASVAQVHRGRLADGRVVAVKVLRPDVRQKVERDAAILRAGARLVALHPRARLSDPVGHLEHFVRGIIDQTDLRLEAAHYETFRRNFENEPRVRFPEVHPTLSSGNVMTMEFVEGKKVDALPPGDHRPLVLLLQDLVLRMCFEHGFVHADLHPGNFLVLPDGNVVLFDVGLVKRLDPGLLRQFTDFTRCMTMGDAKDMVAHLKEFHGYVGDLDWAEVERDLEVFLGHFRQLDVAQLEFGGLVNDLLALARRHRLRPMAEMVLVLVALVTIEGVGKSLYPDRNIFDETARFLGPLLARGQGLGA